jgi:hypothetical protein
MPTSAWWSRSAASSSPTCSTWCRWSTCTSPCCPGGAAPRPSSAPSSPATSAPACDLMAVEEGSTPVASIAASRSTSVPTRRSTTSVDASSTSVPTARRGAPRRSRRPRARRRASHLRRQDRPGRAAHRLDPTGGRGPPSVRLGGAWTTWRGKRLKVHLSRSSTIQAACPARSTGRSSPPAPEDSSSSRCSPRASEAAGRCVAERRRPGPDDRLGR